MIDIIGEKGSSEYDAAVSIAEGLGKLWPGLATSATAQEHVRVAANVKISGYRVSDIDVVVCGVFRRERKFISGKVIHDRDGKRVVKKPVLVENFVIAIEVKDHSENGVRVTADKISVKYSRGANIGWKSATDQNIDQVHSLQPYLKDLGYDVYVHRCLLMRGLPYVGIGGGAVAAGFTGVDLLTAISSVSRVNRSLKGYTLSSGSYEQVMLILSAPIFRSITPTALDRKRMDMIVVSTPDSNQLLAYLGKKMVRLRGHGGTGKTVMSLQMAWKAFDQRGLRSLVLTYNHALAADIRRLLALLKVPSNPEEGGVAVNTVMSFMYSWFNKLQLIEDEEDFCYKNYEKNCDAALELLRGGAITVDDVTDIIKAYPDRYDFDCVIVDEAQDWPQGEVELLKVFYPPRSICLADGIDQVVRQGVRPDWEHGVEENAVQMIALDRCLRMKRNLAVFVNHVAEIGGVKWRVTPNDNAGGGRVKILIRPYNEYEGLHETLFEEAKNKGNAEIDFLFCVPATSVVDRGKRKVSDVGTFLAKAGYEVWDGVDEIARKDFPRSKKQFRVVQYASCRGLEGWTVVLIEADRYWEECRVTRGEQALKAEETAAFEDLAEVSARHAWHRALIALTRPIDTLVIGLNDKSSAFSRALLEVASKCPEFIEIAE